MYLQRAVRYSERFGIVRTDQSITAIRIELSAMLTTEQVAMLSGMGTQVKRLLCLNATATGETLNEVVRAYQGSGLAGCIVTKVDEAATVGNVLDVVIRQKLNLYYVATDSVCLKTCIP